MGEAAAAKVVVPGGERALGFTSPFRMLVSGSTSCGKSRLIARLLRHRERLFDTDFESVSYYFPSNSRTESRTLYIDGLSESCPGLRVHEGFPDIELLAGEGGGHRLVIIDDLYTTAVNSEAFQRLMEVSFPDGGGGGGGRQPSSPASLICPRRCTAITRRSP